MAFTPPSSIAPSSVAAVVTQGTVPWIVDGSAVTQPVSAAALPLPTGAATDLTLTDGSQLVGGTVAVTQSTSPWVTDGSATTQPVSVAGTVAVSVDSLPLPDGAATDATLKRIAASADEIAMQAIIAGETDPV